MAARTSLVKRLKKPIAFEFIGGNRHRRRIVGTLSSVSAFRTDTGVYRVVLRVRRPEDDAGKEYGTHRIVAMFDPATGRATEDRDAFLSGLIGDAAQPEYWPSPYTDPIRTLEPDIAFDAEGFAEGWFFGVSTAFRAALDFRYEEDRQSNRMVWTQGVPPQCRFDVGDVFYHPRRYGPDVRFVLQVAKAGEANLIAEMKDCRSGNVQTLQLTQSEMMAVLRDGPSTGTVPVKQELAVSPA